jgi:hypothetical protein
MPKRYRIELVLTEEVDSNTELKRSGHTENYKDRAEAERKFEEKDRAARNAGKGTQKPSP